VGGGLSEVRPDSTRQEVAGRPPENVASSLRRLIRSTGGNFRLLTRLLTQVERVLSVNDVNVVSMEIVEAARDSLVIGQA